MVHPNTTRRKTIEKDTPELGLKSWNEAKLRKCTAALRTTRPGEDTHRPEREQPHKCTAALRATRPGEDRPEREQNRRFVDGIYNATAIIFVIVNIHALQRSQSSLPHVSTVSQQREVIYNISSNKSSQ